MGSRVAKDPSYPPLHEYKHIVNNNKLRKESRTFTELLFLPSEYSHLSYYYLDFHVFYFNKTFNAGLKQKMYIGNPPLFRPIILQNGSLFQI